MLLTEDWTAGVPLAQEAVDATIAKARAALHTAQRSDGHWVFPLEADVSITAEYILFKAARGVPLRDGLAPKFARYIRARQLAEDGWPLNTEGEFSISSSVKAYFALKLLGDSVDEPHMRRARAAILKKGGAAQTNVFTRSLLALFGEVPWSAIPVMPVEILLLPRWSPFHMDKVSFWARTMMTPLFVVNSLRLRARNPSGIGISELFVRPADTVRRWPGGSNKSAWWTAVFGGTDKLLRVLEPLAPKSQRRRAIAKAEAFVTERLNGADGFGAIYPSMAYSALMFQALGVGEDDPRILGADGSVERLVIEGDDEAFTQPCVSPVWDTALAAHALLEAEDGDATAVAGLDWLSPRQLLDLRGDWIAQKPNLRPGGWAFQYNNAFYPDLDDTAVIVMAMDKALKLGSADAATYAGAIARGCEWIEGLQSRNGGWAAYDADNTKDYLNNIPFADHGAMLDPPTADVTARCISMFAQVGMGDRPSVRRGIDYLLSLQEADGSWFGRWGLNYVYGTWSVLCALDAAGFSPKSAAMRRAATWLLSVQNEDGGWGEGAESYDLDYAGYRPAPSNASHTAWALLGLMAAGVVDEPAVERGVRYLTANQGEDGFWGEARFTGTGFPRVLYLRYHGYPKFFPLWALARYRNRTAGSPKLPLGM